MCSQLVSDHSTHCTVVRLQYLRGYPGGEKVNWKSSKYQCIVEAIHQI